MALSLNLPQVTVAHPWGHEALKAHGRIWCYGGLMADGAVAKGVGQGTGRDGMIRGLVLLLLLAGNAQAQDVYITDAGAIYALDPIEGGAILVNADDPANEVTITQDCRADHAVHGNGSWAWDSDGFLVMFAETELRFDGAMPLSAPGCGG